MSRDQKSIVLRPSLSIKVFRDVAGTVYLWGRWGRLATISLPIELDSQLPFFTISTEVSLPVGDRAPAKVHTLRFLDMIELTLSGKGSTKRPLHPRNSKNKELLHVSPFAAPLSTKKPLLIFPNKGHNMISWSHWL